MLGMVHKVLTVVATLTTWASCTLHETHARCRTDADCMVGQECYLNYCVIADAGMSTSPQTPELGRQPGTRTDPTSDMSVCAPASPLMAAQEGACCAADVACYDGPSGTQDVGICKAGSRACVAGKLATCSDSVVPGSETCNNAGADDDCDGAVDNIVGRGERCELSSGFGSCGEGLLDCADGKDQLSCVRSGPDPTEACNYRDDDCDGQIDESFDISSDAANCGVCGETCGTDELCCGGTCLATSAASASGCPMCGSGQPCADTASCCGGACRDLARDRRHCGSCGHSCEQGERCCGGSCSSSCPEPTPAADSM
jgi:hypothetical protein